MSVPLHCLLRLPACLRRHAFLEGLPQKHLFLRQDYRSDIIRRASGSTSKPALRQVKPPTPKLSPAIHKPRLSPAPAPLPLPTDRGRQGAIAHQLQQFGPEILLYRSPRHRSFFITSMVVGGAILIGAYNWSLLYAKRPPGTEAKGWVGWLVNASSIATALFLAITGTVLVLAPTRMIRTIKLKFAPGTNLLTTQPSVLQIETQFFLKRKTIELPPAEMLLDRRVSAVEIDFKSIPLAKAREFSSIDQLYATPSTPRAQGIVPRAWNTLCRDVRRAMLRDGFAYVRLGNYGAWKLDLQDCELLDNGRPLEQLSTPDSNPGVGIVAWMRRKLA